VNTVLLRHLPYRDSDRLVWITQFIPAQGNTLVFDSDLLCLEPANQVFESMAAYGSTERTLTGLGDPNVSKPAGSPLDFSLCLGSGPC